MVVAAAERGFMTSCSLLHSLTPRSPLMRITTSSIWLVPTSVRNSPSGMITYIIMITYMITYNTWIAGKVMLPG